jgi:predicted porin
MAAFADAKLVGTIDAGLMNNKSAGSTSGTTSFNAGGMTTSYFGFEGSEDLGNGSAAVYELTSFIDNSKGAVEGGANGSLFARSAFVGLKGAYGQLTLGRQANPSFLPVILFNAYGDSAGFGPLWHQTYFNFNGSTSNATALYNDTAWDNAVSYSTPDFAGLTATVTTSKSTATTYGAGTNSGANVLYFHGDLALSAYYMSTQAGSSGSSLATTTSGAGAYFYTNANSKSDITGVGGSYDLHTAKLFATYQEAKSDYTSVNAKTAQVSALVPMGKGNIMAEYATTNYTDSNTTGTTKYSEWAAGYDYNLSKKTDAYVTFGQSSVTGMSNGQTYGAGLRVRF